MARIEKESENEIVYGWGAERTVFEVLENALAETIKLNAEKDVKVYVHTSSGYGDLKVEIKEGMTYDNLHADFLEASKNYFAEKKKQHEEWLKSPEGIAFTKAKEEEKREHEAFVYHSFNEMVEALKQIKPCDLTSGTTSNIEALKLCKDVMLVLLKAEDLRFSEEQQKQISKMLRGLGCCRYKEAAEKFRTLPAKSTIGDTLVAENNIEFPLSAFSNLIDVPLSTFEFGLSKCVDGGKSSWSATWLETQKQAEEKLATVKE